VVCVDWCVVCGECILLRVSTLCGVCYEVLCVVSGDMEDCVKLRRVRCVVCRGMKTGM
jgi:hypothetical protein